MSETIVECGAEPVLARLDTVVDELLTLPLDRCTDEQLLGLWQRLETAKRRLAAVDHRILAQAGERHLAYTHGAASLVALARQVLRISAAEGKTRVSNAEAAGPRTALTGQALPPVYEQVGAAQRAGEISAAHARIITSTIDRLPDPVQADHGAWAEQFLVEQAGLFDPDTLTTLAQRLAAGLDQDGPAPDERPAQRRRVFRHHIREDGTSHGEFDATAELTEYLRTMFDTLARPKPETGGIKDPRSYGQRCHDALLDAIKLAMRAELLPDAGGIISTIILTLDAHDYAAGTGTATTGHGVTIPTEDAKHWAGGDARVIAVVLDKMRAVTAYSTAHRIFTANQRLAMAARDGGCAFPGCDTPPQRCEAHHMIESQDGGPTSTDNGCLLCSYHHREFEAMGWHGHMINHQPHFTPPRHLDPHQTPQQNWMHHPTAGFHGPTAP